MRAKNPQQTQLTESYGLLTTVNEQNTILNWYVIPPLRVEMSCYPICLKRNVIPCKTLAFCVLPEHSETKTLPKTCNSLSSHF